MAKLKAYYLKKDDIPAGLVDAYVERNGRWELEELEDDVPIVQTKKGLETTQTTLKEDLRKANEAKTRAEANQLPAGKIAVEPEIETLGNAAKAANLSATDLTNFKAKAEEQEGKVAELQGKLDANEYEKTLASVAEDHGLNKRFIELAKDKKLKFESRKEKGEDDKETTVWDVVTEKDGKPETQKIGDFFEKDSFFSQFADTFTDSEEGQQTGENTGKKWVKQNTGKEQEPVPGAQKTITNRYGGTLKSLTSQPEAK